MIQDVTTVKISNWISSRHWTMSTSNLSMQHLNSQAMTLGKIAHRSNFGSHGSSRYIAIDQWLLASCIANWNGTCMRVVHGVDQTRSSSPTASRSSRGRVETTLEEHWLVKRNCCGNGVTPECLDFFLDCSSWLNVGLRDVQMDQTCFMCRATRRLKTLFLSMIAWHSDRGDEEYSNAGMSFIISFHSIHETQTNLEVATKWKGVH